jgi:branched-chain amino acid transport system ATP-binding protein
MLAIGRGLMAGPKLLLIDEPSVGLSPMLGGRIANVIRDINADGVSILLVEQNARLALALAKRAYVLERGRIALEGDCAGLINNEHLKSHYLGGGGRRDAGARRSAR